MRLALELRYLVDLARGMEDSDRRSLGPRVREAIERITAVIDSHPHGIRSSHVRHNLGTTRLEWMREHEIQI